MASLGFNVKATVAVAVVVIALLQTVSFAANVDLASSPLDVPIKDLRRSRQTTDSKTFIQPKMIKFELSDAREPDEEVKELIRRHRGRELQLLSNGTTTAKPDKKIRKKITVTKETSSGSDRARIKRLVQSPPEMIPFDESDAREPDPITKELISRGRSLELKQASSSSSTRNAKVKAAKLHRKRSRRSAQQTPPRMIKFEIEDAKEPGEPLKALLKKGNEKEETKRNPDGEMSKGDENNTPSSEEDQDKHESKRFYFYEEAPAKAAGKIRSINSLPHEVQKAISHILKENRGAKAYVKYIPAQEIHKYQGPASNGQKGYGGNYGGGPPPAYVHYVKQIAVPSPAPVHVEVPVPVHVPVHVPVPVQQEIHQVHVQPVIEKIRYVYAGGQGDEEAAYGHHHHHHHNGYLAHAPPLVHEVTVAPIPIAAAVHEEPTAHAHIPEPIIVAEHQHQAQQDAGEEGEGQGHGQVEEVIAPEVVHHHQYSTAGNIFQHSEHAPEPEEQGFKPSPIESQAEGEGGKSSMKEAQPNGGDQGYSHQSANGLYSKNQGPSLAAYGRDPHYHGPQADQGGGGGGGGIGNGHLFPGYAGFGAGGYNQDKQLLNFKNLQEFKELSSLVGKSPEDQIHGLTYLLAKEMQNNLKLQRQQKQASFYGGGDGPGGGGHQEHSSPNLFHSTLNAGHGFGQSKAYVPLSEGDGSKSLNSLAPSMGGLHNSFKYPIGGAGFGAKMPPATSYQSIGLSPNYEGVDKGFGYQGKGPAEKAAGGGAGDLESGHGLQYASKYAFGYRIRDFNTGNDFGHKQNRDLNGVTHGQYHILLPDGRIQNVIYHADDTGFHADVSFETGH